MTSPSLPRDPGMMLQEAWNMENGPGKVALLQEIIRIADVHGDVDLGFEARDELVTAAEYSGMPELILATFPWLLARIDEDPERFNSWAVLWKYKWVITTLPRFPHVPRSTIERAMADLDARFRAAGAGPRSITGLRWKVALETGELDAARRDFDPWRRTPRDHLSDCEACDLDGEVKARLAFGETAEALRLGVALIEGRKRCAEVPHITYGRLLAPLLMTGDPARARALHDVGYALVRSNPTFLKPVGRHLGYVGMADDHATGIRLLERHLPWCQASRDEDARFTFLLGARAILARATPAAPRSTIRLRAPLAEGLGAGAQPLGVLLGWTEQELDRIAARFDGRNGNLHFASLVATSRSQDRRSWFAATGQTN